MRPDSPAPGKTAPTQPRRRYGTTASAVLLVGTIAGELAGLARAILVAVWSNRMAVGLASMYFLLGAWLVQHADLIVLDGLSRSAHAYFAWHNGPPKLAAIGLVWPPITTIVLLPFAIPTQFGSTGLVAPLVSAMIAAVLVALVNLELRRIDIPGVYRYPALALLAAHPMFVFYAANGMSEMIAMLLSTMSIIAFVRWYDTRSITQLSITGISCGLGALTRYELALLTAVILVGVVTVTIREERDFAKARAVAMFFLVPSAYGAIAWLFFNWTIAGSPVWFLTAGGQVSTIAGTTELQADRLRVALSMLTVQAVLSPATMLASLVLATWAIIARRFVVLVLATAVSYNLVTNLVLIGLSENSGFTQLRYNVRALPLGVLAAFWLVRELRRRDRRHSSSLAAIASLGMLAAALPASAYLMQTYAHHRISGTEPYEFSELSFLRAVSTGRELSFTTEKTGQTIGCKSARQMGSYVRTNVHRGNSILADNSSTYAVLLFSGHPERFVDQIDQGRAYFIDQVAKPVRRIRYVLATDFRWCSGVSEDMVSKRWPGLFGADLVPGLELVHETRGFRLFRIHHQELRKPS